MMGSKVTFGRVAGLALVVGVLGTGTAFASDTPQGLVTADDVRLQVIAQTHERSQSGSTPLVLTADDVRLQGIAQAYDRSHNGSTSLGLKAEGLRLQGMAQAFKRPQTRPAASFYTPQALKAEGMRWEAMARAYSSEKPSVGSSSTSGFDWVAAIVGAGSMLGFAMVGVALLLGARRVRRTKVAV